MRRLLSDRLKAVQERMRDALVQAHRPEDSARLVAVTKYQPIELLLELYALGVREMGESRVAEALVKMELLPRDISWHLIGTGLWPFGNRSQWPLRRRLR